MPVINAWRDLHDPDLDDDVPRAVGVLDQVAAIDRAQRWPLLDAVAPWLTHPNPRVRSAALRATSGAAGLAAWSAITAALDDGAPKVRLAALDAFAQTARDDPTRWVIALFHRRADVRRGALQRAADTVHPWIWVRGLADPVLREAIVERLQSHHVEPTLLPFVLEHVRAGHVDRLQGAGLVARVDWLGAAAPLVESLGGSIHDKPIPAWPAELPGWLGDAGDAPLLAQALDLLCEGIDAGEPRCLALASALVERALRDGLDKSFDVVATVLLERPILLGMHLPTPLTILVATRIPSVVGALPGDAARHLLRALASYRRNMGPRTTLRALQSIDLIRREDGSIDLRVAAGLAAITESNALPRIQEYYGADLIAAAVRDPNGAALLVAPPSRKSPGDAVRTRVVREVCSADAEAGASLLARLALQRPSLALPRLGKAALDALVGAVHLLDTDARDGLLKPRAQSIIAQSWMKSALPHSSLLRVLLHRTAEPGPITLIMVGALTQKVGRPSILRLPQGLMKRLLEWDEAEPLMAWPVQQDLVVALTDHADPDLAAWAARHTPKPVTAPVMPLSTGRRALTPKEAGRIAGSSNLAVALAPALESPVTGLLRALAGRTPRPDAAVCAALLMCHDPLTEVATALVAWGFEELPILPQVERRLIEAARNRTDIGPAAGALLFRWDPCHDAFVTWLTAESGRPEQVLGASLALPSPTLRLALWKATRRLVGRWRWRHPGNLRGLVGDLFVRAIVDTLSDRGAMGRRRGGYPHDAHDREAVLTEAAGILARVAKVRGMGSFRAEVEAMRGDLPAAAQRALGQWLMTAGEVVPEPEGVAEGRAIEQDPDVIVHGEDGDALARLVAAPQRGLAELAVLRLVELESWTHLLDALLDPAGPHPDLVSETVPLWQDPRALAALAVASLDPDRPGAVRFHAALGLTEREGEGSPHGRVALQVAADPGSLFVRVSDVKRLAAAVGDPDVVSRALIAAPAFAAYVWAVLDLCDRWPPGAGALLRDFLLLGPSRSRSARLDAARSLRDHGDDIGVALVVADAMKEARTRKGSAVAAGWARRWQPGIVAEITRAAMRAGDRFAPSSPLVEGLFTGGVHRDAIEPSCAAILEQAAIPAVQRRALDGLPTRLARTERAQRLAHWFLWGQDQARKLLSRRFQIRYLVGDDLGLTRLEHRAIYVNPLPLLRGEKNGAAVLRGLIVHELGHHLYNADAEGLRVWSEAEKEGLGRLHNLVCDEHLERNLRGVDPSYGDDLKKLGAWAFLHARRTIQCEELLRLLGAEAATALIPTPLSPARTRGQISLPLGRLFRALEAGGSSFSRFFRALRMGLGDRHGDPRVRQALELFGKDFRDLDNPGLLSVTRALAELFRGELGILDVTDVHATSAGEEGDDAAEGRGVTNSDVQREVKRIQGSKDGIGAKPGKAGRASRGSGTDAINIGGDDDFNRIDHIETLVHVPADHAPFARDVARDARHLRDAFAKLGLQHRWVGPRVRGTRLDRARLLGASLRGDPRVLRARHRVFAADLHLSVVVDCSGSMEGDRMDRAQRMATLLAEASRGLDGVDLRLFGFTDSTIYDAGDDQRCAAHALHAGGGNNDAAGLQHAALTALASPRLARLVVMISDGRPTDCTTAALTGLVKRLQRRHHLPCAQIAVAPIEERCFDTYLEVLDDDTGAAVRRFGSLVTGLVANTLRG